MFYIDRQNLGLSNRRLLRSLYKWKVIDATYAIVLAILDGTIVHWVHPYQRQFTINDITISHPFTEHERIPVPLLLELVVFVSPVVMTITNRLFTPPGKRIYVFYISFLGLIVSVTTCDFMVDTLKNWIGRCRPDFLARCIPAKDALPDTLYYAKEICTTTDKPLLLDGFRTTPSGHASISFACFGYLTMWMMGQLLGCSCNYVGAWRFLVSCLPSLFASYVAFSRTQDYRHHFVDVVLGSLMGWLVAWWSYRRYFPSVFLRYSYVPSIILDTAEKGPDDYKTHDFYMEQDWTDSWPGRSDLESQTGLRRDAI
ncbi:hypothetical protein FOA43_002951 [Brettanomyces nanus]|uniref:Phosphatidic acid phosphatase type 2/haloperoxidase domain-containing protein n=1 Tax=Eeniella nana TaxID=13502 RepID=A0A875S938_EENNA|nr:uncharacterized protein FOA43_002951 [Brettanomyces nanus]QPG75594.1 hypothetical protein FOA43_002951 [Brettanomyces nanus]